MDCNNKTINANIFSANIESIENDVLHVKEDMKFISAHVLDSCGEIE